MPLSPLRISENSVILLIGMNDFLCYNLNSAMLDFPVDQDSILVFNPKIL